MDRLAAMEAFVRVAESRSFSETSRRLRVSKSQVSRQVAALEADLGVRLLQRTTRSLTLTEAGQGYFAQAVRILGDIEEANRSVSRLQTAPRGQLRVSAPMSFGVLHLAPCLADFLARYPEVEVDLALNDRFVDLIDEGYDAAIRIGRLAESSFVARKLAPARRVVCAAPAYLAEHGAPTSPDDLVRHHCLCYSNLTRAEEWTFVSPDGRPWPVEVRGRLRVNNGDALRAAALQGLGVAYLPTFLVGGDLQAGALVSVLDAYLADDVAIYAVYPHSRHLSPKVRVFIDFLAERLSAKAHGHLPKA
jgi:DNA-binding transcriptional LysR family regulator